MGALSKSGSSFVVSDEKSYDAWGGLRSGTNANGKAAYCANLGHKQDDESGLIYMRARYYESTSGRFVNADPCRAEDNWFVYSSNDPINYSDVSGKMTQAELVRLFTLITVNAALFSECKAIAVTWTTGLLAWVMDNWSTPVGVLEEARKFTYLLTLDYEVMSKKPLDFGDVKQKAKSVGETYSAMLQLAYWVTQDPGYL